jgi:hypothetical protein
MNGLSPTQIEPLFLAGCAGALMPMLLRWMFSPSRTQKEGTFQNPALLLLYLLVGGYFAGAISGATEPCHAFAAGALMDVSLRTLRRVARRFDL